MKTKELVISIHDNDITKIKKIINDNKHFNEDNVYVYDKSEVNVLNLDDFPCRYKKIENVGFNIYSWSKHIVENYENLSDTIIFIKGNIIDRGHTTEENFIKSLDVDYFFPIELYHPSTHLKVNDNGYIEPNNDWYADKFPSKYAKTYNQFLDLLFENNYYPDFIRFAPGGNYVVPKECILKYSKNLYKKINLFVSHHKLSLESYFTERLMHSLWSCDYREKFQ